MIALALEAPSAGLSEHPGQLLALLAGLALLPAGVVVLTSFLKISVVLSILRSALGAPQVPPSSAITGLSLLLTALAMGPVAEDAWLRARSAQSDGLDQTLAAVSAASEPFRAFLGRFAREDDRQTFLELAQRARTDASRPAAANDLHVLAPAFVVSELRRAFTIGFLLFLPFLVVDLLVGNVLLGLGLQQLSPTIVALPFKLLLFVSVDGMRLVCRGLVLGYLG